MKVNIVSVFLLSIVLFWLVGIVHAGDEWYKHYDDALKAIEWQDWETSVTLLRKAIEGNFNDQSKVRTYGMHFIEYFPHRELGIALHQLGEIDEARRELQLSLSQAPSQRAQDYLSKIESEIPSKFPAELTTAGMHSFHLRDGTTIQGKIIAQDDSTLLVETQHGTLEIKKTVILKLEQAELFSQTSTEEIKIIRLLDGTIINGSVIFESVDSLAVQTMFGTLIIPKSDIKYLQDKPKLQRKKAILGESGTGVIRTPRVSKPIQNGSNRPYVGFTVPHLNIGSGFDGKTILTKPGEVILVPEIKVGFGFGILAGVKSENSAAELNYLWSEHDVSFLGVKGKASYKMVNLDIKVYTSTHKPIQPYLLIGWCIPWIVVEDASASVDEYGDIETGDATFTTAFGGINIGAGLEWYITPTISANGGLLYRFISYTIAEGAGKDGVRMEESLKGNDLNFSFGMAVTL